MAGKLEIVEGEKALVGLVTCPDEETASALAEALVDEQAAACVNIIPGLTSIYRWKGEVCRDREYLLVIKTTSARREAVAEQLTALHPYEEPELIFLPLDSGSRGYLGWLAEQVRT
mgnify:CR=1 FL=1